MKPTYDQLVDGLRKYSMILHDLEENGVDLDKYDETWLNLTMLEQNTKE